ncbi:MAG: acyl-CoA dehydrogenase family protein [Gammaproteobacteria bacterium]|nr:acyl-CoA dehydrogenase family protein [Gammaproteobacteria bacterium]
MSQFTLTQEQDQVRQLVRKVAENRIAPRAPEIDQTGEFPWDILAVLREHELLGAVIPPEYGGSGLGYLSACLINEEIARVCMNSAMVVATQCLAMKPILIAGTEQQKQTYLPPLASGEKLGAFACTEPDAGSDTGAMRTVASLRGERYVLNGTKHFISAGNVADVVVVFARTETSQGLKGISAFIVEKDTPGFTCGRVEKKLGVRASPSAELIFSDCQVPRENLLGGTEGAGMSVLMRTLDRGRVLQAGLSLGVAQGALDFAVSYARQRVQFGRPIGNFQGIQFMVAERATELEAARQLAYAAAARADQHDGDVGTLGAMSKLFASEVALKVTSDAMRVLGGYGYMQDYPLERMLRDARFLIIGEGTSEIQKLVIGRALLTG